MKRGRKPSTTPQQESRIKEGSGESLTPMTKPKTKSIKAVKI